MQDSSPLPSDRPDLKGIQFISKEHVGNVIWTVEYYHRNGEWQCREALYGTTMNFHESKILEWKINS